MPELTLLTRVLCRLGVRVTLIEFNASPQIVEKVELHLKVIQSICDGIIDLYLDI